MEGWVDLGALITSQLGIEPTTTGSKVRRPNRCATKTSSVDTLTIAADKYRSIMKDISLHFSLIITRNNVTKDLLPRVKRFLLSATIKTWVFIYIKKVHNAVFTFWVLNFLPTGLLPIFVRNSAWFRRFGRQNTHLPQGFYTITADSWNYFSSLVITAFVFILYHWKKYLLQYVVM